MFFKSEKPIKKGIAKRVIFFYAGEEGTYVDDVYIEIYSSGIVYLRTDQEESTTHITNCEILWRFDTEYVDSPGPAKLSRLRVVNPTPEKG